MRPFYLYILRCSDGSYYAGHTDDLEHRMNQHREAEEGYVADHRPFELVYVCEFAERIDALERER